MSPLPGSVFLSLNNIITFLLHVYGCSACMNVSVQCVCLKGHRSQISASGSPGIGVTGVVVSIYVGVENQAQVLCRRNKYSGAINTPTCLVISPAPSRNK